MGKIEDDAYKYSCTVVLVFGILGNILVTLSILRQKKSAALKNNYYFLVLHLAICDLAVLVIYLYITVEPHRLEEPLSVHFPIITCHVYAIADAFQFVGAGMMLTISLLRYRATVHPLKPAISRRKLKLVSGLMYLVGLIAACATHLPECHIKSTVVYFAYLKFCYAFWIFFVYFVPTIFMAVVYYKIALSLIKQNEYIKRVSSNPKRGREYDSSFNIMRYIRNRRTFLVCLSTVLCYGIAHIPMAVWCMWRIAGENHLLLKYVWVKYSAIVLKMAGSHSLNPLIYGILDKKLLTFWKCSCEKKWKTQENYKIVAIWNTITLHEFACFIIIFFSSYQGRRVGWWGGREAKYLELGLIKRARNLGKT